MAHRLRCFEYDRDMMFSTTTARLHSLIALAGRNVGKGLAGVFSFASGLVFLTVYFVISTYAAKAQGPSKLGFKGESASAM